MVWDGWNAWRCQCRDCGETWLVEGNDYPVEGWCRCGSHQVEAEALTTARDMHRFANGVPTPAQLHELEDEFSMAETEGYHVEWSMFRGYLIIHGGHSDCVKVIMPDGDDACEMIWSHGLPSKTGNQV